MHREDEEVFDDDMNTSAAPCRCNNNSGGGGGGGVCHTHTQYIYNIKGSIRFQLPNSQWLAARPKRQMKCRVSPSHYVLLTPP